MQAFRKGVLPVAFIVWPWLGLHAEPISNPIAMLAGLNKITGVTTSFEVQVGQEVRFGGLIVKPDICYSRPATEEPKTTSFLEVDSLNDGEKRKRIFNGWVFAESPGLNGIEHPVYDIWLTGCRDPNIAITPINEINPAQQDVDLAPPSPEVNEEEEEEATD